MCFLLKPSIIVTNSESDNFMILEGDPITIIVKEILKEHLPSKKKNNNFKYRQKYIKL